jgi:hypothetical protein
MPFLLSLVLSTGLAAVSQDGPENPPPAQAAIPVLKPEAVPKNAIKQVTTASPKLGYRTTAAVCFLERGLLYLPEDRPILAMAEADGWFFYATSVARDGQTGVPVYMISGYAVKRDGRHVVGFSVW